MTLQDIGTFAVDNLPTWLVLVWLAYLWRKERSQAGIAVENALTSQVRVLSAAHETLLVTNTTMSRRFDEIESVRGKERHEREMEREAEERLRCEQDAKIDVLEKSVSALSDMTRKQDKQIAELQEDVKRRDARIAELEKKLGERDARITELERKSSDLKGERELLLARVSELTVKVDEVQKRETVQLGEAKPQTPETPSDASAQAETIEEK